MPTLTIKGMPDVLYRRLKSRAKGNRRSLNQEILACLEVASVRPPRDVTAILADIDRLHARWRGKPLTSEEIEEGINWGRR